MSQSKYHHAVAFETLDSQRVPRPILLSSSLLKIKVPNNTLILNPPFARYD